MSEIIGNSSSTHHKLSCVICGDSTPGVVLLPCRHSEICPPCFFQLGESGCPLCRSKIEKIFFSPTQTTHDFNKIVSYRQEEEVRVISKVFQIVVVGFSDSNKILFGEAMKEIFALPEMREALGDAPMEMEEPIFQSEDNSQLSLARGEHPSSIFKSFENNFSPNMRLFGHECRITVVSTSAIDYDFHVHEEIRRLKPDVVVICASTDAPSVPASFRLWNKVAKYTQNVQTIWVAVPGYLPYEPNEEYWKHVPGLTAAIPPRKRFFCYSPIFDHRPQESFTPEERSAKSEEIKRFVKSRIYGTAEDIVGLCKAARSTHFAGV